MDPAFVQSRFLFLAFILLVYASRAAAASTSQSIPKRQADGNIKCGFQGNNDAYGLGIRLAMYIQWITCLLTSCFFEGRGPSVILITTCFRLSMIIALLYLTILQGSNMQVSEAYLMLMICVGGVNSSDMPDLSLMHRPDRKGAEAHTAALGIVIQSILLLVLTTYTLWFLFTGMDSMQHPPCSRSGFFLARVDLYHWIRTFYEVTYVLGISVFLLTVVVFIIPYLRRPQTLNLPMPPTSGPVAETDLNGNPSWDTMSVSGSEHRFASGLVDIVLGVTWLCWLILGIELIIKWNHIQGVNQMGSTGQILPFVVAVGGLISATCQFLLQTVSVEGSGGVEIAVV